VLLYKYARQETRISVVFIRPYESSLYKVASSISECNVRSLSKKEMRQVVDHMGTMEQVFDISPSKLDILVPASYWSVVPLVANEASVESRRIAFPPPTNIIISCIFVELIS